MFVIETLLYFPFVLAAIIVALRSMKRGEEYMDKGGKFYFLFLCAILYTIIGPIIGFMRFDEFEPEIPFAKKHVLSIIMLVTTSSAAFWLAKLTRTTTNPLIRIILSVGMLQGIVLCAITTIHFIPFISKGLAFPFIGFELLSPPIAFCLLLREFYFYNNVVLSLDDLLPYHKEMGFIPWPHKLFQLPVVPRLSLYVILMLGAVAGQALLAYAAGQDIDSIVKAFTQSVGFIFSQNNY